MAIVGGGPPGENTPISFPTWNNALAQAGLPSAVRGSHEGEIWSFRRFCQVAHAPATVALARHYVAHFGDGDTPAREVLRWFVRASRQPTLPD